MLHRILLGLVKLFFSLHTQALSLSMLLLPRKHKITATNRQYDSALDDFRRYAQVREAIRQQVLSAIDATFYNVLEDETFGYADVTIIQLLNHLQTSYALLTDDDLEQNRQRLAEPWTPDEPFENLWVKIKHLRSIATAGGEPLTERYRYEIDPRCTRTSRRLLTPTPHLA